MFRDFYSITRIQEVAERTYVISFRAPELVRSLTPGQFINIKTSEDGSPLFRRPFSIYRTDGDEASIIYTRVGKGTNALCSRAVGEKLDVLGPLGMPWQYENATFETAILVAGGVGVAAMPTLVPALEKQKKKVLSFLGGRTKNMVVRDGLPNLTVATDDGSEGFHGNAVAALKEYLAADSVSLPKIFACGPTPMLRAVTNFAKEKNILCEVSLETEMACGIGICQGCPVEVTEEVFRSSGRKYHLVCTQGPSFDCNAIIL